MDLEESFGFLQMIDDGVRFGLVNVRSEKMQLLNSRIRGMRLRDGSAAIDI